MHPLDHAVSAPPASLPGDLQGRLDVILAKPLLRRAPALQQAIETLVRNAYARAPHPVSPAEHRPSFDSCSCYLCTTARNILTGTPLPTLDEIRKLAAGENQDGVL